MAHLALYRKWRPDVFEDIVGQEHITKTLKNQILTNRVGHAYLFCGTRGTGKTTCAKVFSRAVNCRSPKNGSPCNECEICKGIADGSILDVTELDAASNRRIDDIREIINDVSYVAAEAKYSVYIIDEVHMLTTEAFNALLKTLEEPPEHVIFILATTDPQKVPQTILSRCQRFDFKRISINDITVRLKEVAYGDGFNITEDAYRLIASLGDGSMRDSLSVLERVASACGDTITSDDIIEVLGISTRDSVFNMTDAITHNDPEGIVSVIDSLINEGKDLNSFIDSLMQYFRDLMMYSVSNGATSLLDYSSEDIVKLKAQSSRLTFEKITRATSILSSAKADAKWVKSPRIIYELALIKLARPEVDTSPEALLDRLADIENRVHATRDEELYSRVAGIEEKIKNGLVAAAPAVKEETPPPQKKVAKRIYNPIPANELNGDNPIVALAKRWDSICSAIIKKAGYFAIIQNRPITVDRDGIILLFNRDESTTLDILSNNKDRLDKIFTQISGSDCAIKFVYEDELGDNLIDIWTLKPSASPVSASTINDDEEDDSDEAFFEDIPIPDPGSSDPLDELNLNFKELIEVTDGTEFIDYSPDDDTFNQATLSSDDEPEEFLDDNELASMKNEDE